MQKYINLRTIAISLLGAYVPALIASAQTIENPLRQNSFAEIVQSVVTFAGSVLPPLLMLMILIGGFFYMTAGGNEQRVKTAHKILIWAMVGAAIVLLSQSAYTVVCELVGGCNQP